MSATTLPSYIELTEALQKTTATVSAAEAHGIVCGIICSTPGKPGTQWEKLLLGPKKNAPSKELLQALYTTSYQQMDEFSFEFSMLLPDDNININERTEALGLWCQGFLIGLQQGPATLQEQGSSEAVEAISDITEIAQVSFGDINSTDADEAAYLELVEYVRLAVVMLYHEFRATAQTGSVNNLLH